MHQYRSYEITIHSVFGVEYSPLIAIDVSRHNAVPLGGSDS
jgi:hypothetical protein